MTQQTAFNRVWNWFVCNKRNPAVTQSGSCVLLNNKGDRCAIGCLIPASIQIEKNNGSINEQANRFPWIKRIIIDGLGSHFLLCIRLAHDCSWAESQAEDSVMSFHELIRSKLEQVADEHGLKVPRVVCSK